MTILFRPMLSAKLPCAEKRVPTQEEVIRDLERLNWERGFWASPKMDGIRAVKHPTDGLVSRTLKPIPNRFIQHCLSDPLFNLLDGEIVKGEWNEPENFNDTQSVVMSREGEPFFTFCVFDDVKEMNNAFWWRNTQALERVKAINETTGDPTLRFKIHHLEQVHVQTIDELLRYEEDIIALGYEGIMFRDPGGRYKSFPSNRSTFKQQGLIKLKRFIDAEAIITGFIERERNTNQPTRDNLGYQRRSAHKAGQVLDGTLGKLCVRGANGRFVNCEFNIGSGLDDSLRDRIWANRESYLGMVVRYKYQDAGAKDAPRSPIFLGFRDPIDIEMSPDITTVPLFASIP